MLPTRSLCVRPLFLAACLSIPIVSSAVDPQFAAPVSNPFGLSGPLSSWPSSDLADIDGDGDFDLVIGNYEGGILLSTNTGSAIAPAFSAPTQVVADIPAPPPPYYAMPGWRSYPSVADLDGDGDLDICAGTIDGYGQRIYNTGNATSPSFSRAGSLLSLRPLSDNSGPYDLFGSAEACDLNGDGTLEILVGAAPGHFSHFTGAESSGFHFFPAANMLINPFGIQDKSGFAGNFAELVDIDGDGDEDVFKGGFPHDLEFQRNLGSPTSPSFGPEIVNPFGFVPVTISLTVSYAIADLDDDGDQDLLVASLGAPMTYYQNTAPADGVTLGVAFNTGTSPTADDIVVFDVVFTEPVGNSFTEADVDVTGTLSAAAVSVTPGTLPTQYSVFVELADHAAGGTVGIQITGNVRDQYTDVLAVPAASALYSIRPAGDVSKNGTFDIGDVALLSDANLSLAILP